ncbi:hypothetical protein QYE76_049796 [Lolium multiflorum]|uniref:Uncharacterized protein n=1 Tax=Lolium multiflorum TaxID=4521 RepID=A0AAD8SQC4_LOLMU|nr:hypothetical protein QYE76_049796 [Lolium multiflorum]
MAPPPHIAVVAFPFSSHAAVMLSFVHALAAAAPDGTAISFVTTADYALLGNLRFVEVADGLPAPSGQMPMLPSPRRMELFMAAQGGASLRWRRQGELCRRGRVRADGSRGGRRYRRAVGACLDRRVLRPPRAHPHRRAPPGHRRSGYVVHIRAVDGVILVLDRATSEPNDTTFLLGDATLLSVRANFFV